MKKERSALFRGLMITLTVMLIARVLSVISSEHAGADDSVERILYIVIFVLDSAIFACGAATILRFTGQTRNVVTAAALVISLTALDYIMSFTMDSVLGNFYPGTESYIALYLALNLLVRALTFGLMIVFAEMYTRSLPDTYPAPVFSRHHAVPVKMAVAAILHIVPSFLYEIYSNISGVIEYGWNMTARDVLAIISAYGEIAVDGAITYFTIYVVLYALRKKDLPQ